MESSTALAELTRILNLIQEILALAQSRPELRPRATAGVAALAAAPLEDPIQEAETLPSPTPLKSCRAFVEIREVLNGYDLKRIPCTVFRQLAKLELPVKIHGKLSNGTTEIYWRLNEHWGEVRPHTLNAVRNWAESQSAGKKDPADGA
jgi:hypothetical protein